MKERNEEYRRWKCREIEELKQNFELAEMRSTKETKSHKLIKDWNGNLIMFAKNCKDDKTILKKSLKTNCKKTEERDSIWY